MRLVIVPPDRPDIAAARRGGDISVGMDGEGETILASVDATLFWRNTYSELVALEEGVLDRVQGLIVALSAEARHEVELTNVPVFEAQLERFRSRLRLWETRLDDHPDLA